MKRFSLLPALGILLLAPVLAPDRAPSEPRKVIIDTDPGTDDALAILLALNSPEVDVKGITVVPGNVIAAQGLENALKIVSLAGRCDIPVAGGARHPLVQKLITAEYWHGANGLANIELPASECKADPRFGPDLIIDLVHQYPHQITVVPVGPEENVALALLKDPSIAGLVKDVVVMGGATAGGNVNAVAEANIYYDPEAARIVFNAGWPLTMVGLDVGDRTLVKPAHVAQLARTHGPQNDFAVGLLNFMESHWVAPGSEGAPMYDELAVGAVIDPTLITTRNMRVDVELNGEFTRGETVANRNNSVEHTVFRDGRYVVEGIDHVEPNVHVAVGSDAERFIQMLIAHLAGK